MDVRGTTTVAVVIGWPVEHSLSPAIHNAAFLELGLDWVMVPAPVAPGAGGAAVEALRALGIAGASVTMPHKQDVIGALDRLSGDADALGAVNCIVASGDLLVGLNTDGPGFLEGLRDDFGFEVDGRRCAVVGAGGAARAVVRALGAAGAAEVRVIARQPGRAHEVAQLAGGVGAPGGPEVLAEVDLVVNATPVGMGGDPNSPVAAELLRPHHVVADLVYDPSETPLMRAARLAGARTSNGLSMLVHQAALAFEAWTGRRAPLDAMRRGALAALERTPADAGSDGPVKS